MTEDNILLEGRAKIEDTIESQLVRFYTHIAKIINIDEKSGSWLNSIYGAADTLSKIKKNSPAAYQGYVIKDNIESINRKVVKELEDNGNNIDDFYLPYVYSSFPELDLIVNRTNLNNFLQRYIKDTKLYLQW